MLYATLLRVKRTYEVEIDEGEKMDDGLNQWETQFTLISDTYGRTHVTQMQFYRI